MPHTPAADDPGGERYGGFVIEHPQSIAAAPKYLSYRGDDKARWFEWTTTHVHALRFMDIISAEQIAAISKHFQPELWHETQTIGPPRIANIKDQSQ